MTQQILQIIFYGYDTINKEDLPVLYGFPEDADHADFYSLLDYGITQEKSNTLVITGYQQESSNFNINYIGNEEFLNNIFEIKSYNGGLNNIERSYLYIKPNITLTCNIYLYDFENTGNTSNSSLKYFPGQITTDQFELLDIKEIESIKCVNGLIAPFSIIQGNAGGISIVGDTEENHTGKVGKLIIDVIDAKSN